MAAPTGRLTRLQRELIDLEQNPLNFIQNLTLSANDEGLQQLTGVMLGPDNSPYASGHFRFIMTFPPDFPFKPPTFAFSTAICHPNIHSGTGALSISILLISWVPRTTLRQVFESIHSLLNSPNYDTPIEADTTPDKNPEKARQWTLDFAQSS